MPWQGRAGRTLRRWLASGRGGLLRVLLLRVRHPVLPGPEPERARRPSRDTGRGGALRILARGRAAAPAPRARRHGGPRGRLPAARRSKADGRDREELPARRRRSPSPSAPVRRERLAQRRGEPGAAGKGAHPRPPRARRSPRAGVPWAGPIPTRREHRLRGRAGARCLPRTSPASASQQALRETAAHARRGGRAHADPRADRARTASSARSSSASTPTRSSRPGGTSRT